MIGAEIDRFRGKFDVCQHLRHHVPKRITKQLARCKIVVFGEPPVRFQTYNRDTEVSRLKYSGLLFYKLRCRTGSLRAEDPLPQQIVLDKCLAALQG